MSMWVWCFWCRNVREEHGEEGGGSDGGREGEGARPRAEDREYLSVNNNEANQFPIPSRKREA